MSSDNGWSDTQRRCGLAKIAPHAALAATVDPKRHGRTRGASVASGPVVAHRTKIALCLCGIRKQSAFNARRTTGGRLVVAVLTSLADARRRKGACRAYFTNDVTRSAAGPYQNVARSAAVCALGADLVKGALAAF